MTLSKDFNLIFSFVLGEAGGEGGNLESLSLAQKSLLIASLTKEGKTSSGTEDAALRPPWVTSV